MKTYIDTDRLIQHIEDKIRPLKPNEIPENIADIIPGDVWNAMSDYIRKDIQEMYNVYYNEYWTATSLMAYRILEYSLQIHIEEDLHHDDSNTLKNAIDYLRYHKYPESIVNQLDECRLMRNKFMHGEKRASSADAKFIVGYTMLILLQIFNMIPE